MIYIHFEVIILITCATFFPLLNELPELHLAPAQVSGRIRSEPVLRDVGIELRIRGVAAQIAVGPVQVIIAIRAVGLKVRLKRVGHVRGCWVSWGIVIFDEGGQWCGRGRLVRSG